MNDLVMPLARLSIPDGVSVFFGSVYGDLNNSDGSCEWRFDMNFESDFSCDIGWKFIGDWFDSSGNRLSTSGFHYSNPFLFCERKLQNPSSTR